MAFGFTIPLRGIQAVFALIVLGLTAYVAHEYHDHESGFISGYYHSPSQVDFLIFTSVWTLLAVLYLTLTPMLMVRLAHRFAVAAVEALTMLFWFAGFIALAVFVARLGICHGHVCDCLRAAVVFAAFEWVLFVITTVIAMLEIFSGGRSARVHGGGKPIDPAYGGRV